MIKQNTFGQRVAHFYNSLSVPENIPDNISAIHPRSEFSARPYVDLFFEKFFNDNKKRVFVLGINPGRFGSGVTGIPFTDPISLEKDCGIENFLQKRRELSSEFVYNFISVWGGAEKFYNDFFLTAISPIGFTSGGKNYNYYDDPSFLKIIKPFILRTLRQQIDFGAKQTAIIFGTGKNAKIFSELNSGLNFFDNVYTLEHPRYIMQYKRKDKNEYVEKYMETFKKALV